LRQRQPPGCTGLYLADSDAGPLLARTCDLEPDVSAEIQLLRRDLPEHGPATLTITYLGLTGGVGVNEHGFGLTGSSASARPPAGWQPSPSALPGGLLNYLVMHQARSVTEATELLARHPFAGKGANLVLGDASGTSAFVELLPGQGTRVSLRRAGRDWQACSNFCYSPDLVPAVGPAYLENAYTRYGRLVHQVDEGFMPRTLAGVKALFTDLAQPGPVVPREHCTLHTAYAFVVELARRRLHFTPGHPARHAWETLTL